MAKKINARLVWVASVSEDVVEQKLVVNVNDVVTVDTILGPEVVEHPLILAENDHVVATIDCFDGNLRSVAVNVDTTIGDFTAPEPPTDFNLVVDSVEEV